VTFYTDEQTLHDLDKLSNERDTTRSTLIHNLLRDALAREREGELAAETRAMRRLQALVDEGKEDMKEIARQQQDLNAKTGAYAIAVFELVKQRHGDAEVKQALQTGARRLRDDDSLQEALEDADDRDDQEGESLVEKLRDGEDDPLFGEGAE
jgi:hemerythrin-like domain-containing protein